MAKPLAQRIEEATEAVIAAVLTDAQTLHFGETDEAGKDYILVRAVRVSEDPPTSGIFAHDVNVIAHGNFSDSDLHNLEELMDNANELAGSLRTQGTGSFVMPQGQAVEIDGNTKSGQQLDENFQYNFGIWAQTQEVSDAAA
jgi:hypothetical protein